MPGQPPGHQRGAGACSTLEKQVPAGAWLVYRPSEGKRTVKIWVYGERRPTLVRVFDLVTGGLLSEQVL
jgi:hypothetical protein